MYHRKQNLFFILLSVLFSSVSFTPKKRREILITVLWSIKLCFMLSVVMGNIIYCKGLYTQNGLNFVPRIQHTGSINVPSTKPEKGSKLDIVLPAPPPVGQNLSCNKRFRESFRNPFAGRAPFGRSSTTLTPRPSIIVSGPKTLYACKKTPYME